MRLRQIKLAGFKSFADPALIELIHPVVGIVGPNGCGKSNIIDAVRWVLGEARVSELRGSASMKELIFAGSTSRQPMGRASVELILQNDDGRLKGPWADYAELSVKRVVTSDGHSSYFINHQQVRRRDVQEIFLGTGLGPRSYAIISQGMISNFIRARPEEMRVYLEEAAGVSLYRERRKETESLLNQTRGNLERVRDMQVVKQEEATRLEAEAEVARRWQALTEEKNAAEALWYWIQYAEVHETLKKLDAEIAKGEAEIETKKAEATHAAQGMPALETAVREAENLESAANMALREAEKKLTTAEAEIKRRQEQRQSAEAEIQKASITIAAKKDALQTNQAVMARNATELRELEAALDDFDERLAAAEEVMYEAEDAWTEANARATTARRAEADAKSQAKVAVTKAEAAVKRATDCRQRLMRLTQTQSGLEAPDTKEVERLKLDLEEGLAFAEEARAKLEMATIEAEDASAARDRHHEAYFSALAQQKEAAAKLDALEAIQKKAEAGGKLSDFEAKEGLDGLPRLAEGLDTDPRWVTAAEAVLGAHAAAKCLRFLETAKGYEGQRPPALLGFVEKGEPTDVPQALNVSGVSLAPLLSFVKVRDADLGRALADRLHGVYCVDDLATGLRLRQALPQGAMLVTPKGDRLTRATLAIWAADDPSLSLLSRQQEIAEVRERLYALEDQLDDLDKARQAGQMKAESAAREVKVASERARQAEQAVNQIRVDLKTQEERLAAYQQRLADLKRSRDELEDECEEAAALAEEANELADEAEETAEKVAREMASVLSEAKRTEDAFKAKQNALTTLKHQGEMARLKESQLKDARRLLEQSDAALNEDIRREETRITLANEVIATTKVAIESSNQMEALEALQKAEVDYRDKRDATEKARLALATMQAAYAEAQSLVMPMTEALGVKRVERQMKESLRTQFDDRLLELNADRQALAEVAAARPQKAQSVRAKVLRLISEIAGLGAVNHAALEHLEAVKRTLEATARQVEDLEKGIETLEAAIRKIDAETRERLKATFEEVNGYFGQTFTDLFGGGHAELVMTGDDVLAAGVEVKAQPPGKKNTGVKLLSGGEQALTATALVFAIFKLNPAPFCLLDEVDAPLDEANQARLAGLCRTMSKETQFLMITHHRVTMEFAGALIGVTMKEAGVSRVVSVDVENAVRIAGA